MIIYLVYLIVILIGVFTPITLSFAIQFYILSIVFDDIRINDISITNIFLSLLIIKLIANVDYFKLLRLNWKSIYVIYFSGITFIAFMISHEAKGLKSLVSISVLLFITLCMIKLMRFEKYKTVVLRAIFTMSLIAAFSVVMETSLFYGLQIRLRENTEFGLQNLQTHFYFSSGFFASNGIAAFHIIPGIFISHFGAEKTKWRIVYRFVLWLGLLGTMTRGGIVVGLLVLLVLIIKYIRQINGILKPLAYGTLAVLLLGAVQVVIFVSAFNFSSVVARLFILNGTLQSIRQHPLFGTGLSSQVKPVTSDIDFGDAIVSDYVLNASDFRETHNTFFQIALETGLIGLGCFLFLLIQLLRTRYKNAFSKNLDDNTRRGYYRDFWILFFLLISINMNSYLYMKLLWLLIGFVSQMPGESYIRKSPKLQLAISYTENKSNE